MVFFWPKKIEIEPSDDFSITKAFILMIGLSAVICSFGYLLKPVSEIIDELHDSSE